KIKATRLGVSKIVLDATSGKIVFVPDPPVDPDRIICLIQQNAEQIRMSGSNELAISVDLPDPERRISFVEDLLDKLAIEN
ncbi:MAG: hypothetical protein QGI25_02955, partial [Arenicellales bacterium]|nr:hypothetical protein [Arenicellales bacterium]